jgi:hypothetical protein
MLNIVMDFAKRCNPVMSFRRAAYPVSITDYMMHIDRP